MPPNTFNANGKSHACVAVWRVPGDVCCLSRRFSAARLGSKNAKPTFGFGRCIGCFLNGGHFVGNLWTSGCRLKSKISSAGNHP